MDGLVVAVADVGEPKPQIFKFFPIFLLQNSGAL